MKGKFLKTVMGSALSCLLASWLLAGTAFGLDLSLVAEEATVTMPNSSVITMWGLRDVNDPGHPAGEWQVPVFTTTDAVLNIDLTNSLPADTANLAKPTSLIIPGLVPTELGALVPTWTDGSTGSRFADPNDPQPAELEKRVRSITHEATNGGGSETFSWNLKPGTYLIQSGTHQAVQVQMGLFAVLVVKPAMNQAYGADTAFTSEQVLVYSEIDSALHTAVATENYGPGMSYSSTMNYHPDYYLINGQPYAPGTLPIQVGRDIDTILLRFVNAGYETRVPVLQGDYFTLIAEDGNLLPYSQEVYSVELTAGKTKDVIWTPSSSGLKNLYDGRFHLTNAGASGGGLLTKLNVASTSSSLAVITPNGGEPLTGLTTAGIMWAEHPGAATYWVRLSTNGGTSWSRLATLDAALGTTYNWLIPNTINTSEALINVIAFSSSGQWLATDSSDAVFSITPSSLTVLAPNGGEPLAGLSTTTIQWSAYPNAATYWVRFSSDNGATWSRLATLAAAQGTSYDWAIPNTINTQNALINVIAFNGSGQWLATDTSDAVFSITPSTLTVLAPNGGEPLAGSSTTTIEWSAYPNAATYWVRFSSDNGTTWSRLATLDAASGTSYAWTIPNNIDSANCLVNVIAFNSTGQWLAADSSDGAFSVTPSVQ